MIYRPALTERITQLDPTVIPVVDNPGEEQTLTVLSSTSMDKVFAVVAEALDWYHKQYVVQDKSSINFVEIELVSGGEVKEYFFTDITVETREEEEK